MTDGAGDRVLYSAGEISRRVTQVAKDITAGSVKPDIAVPVLAGAFVFAADLMRALAQEGFDLATEFVWLRSYGMGEKPEEVVALKAPERKIIRGRTVLLIDGVVESGATLAYAAQMLVDAGAAAILSVVAVQKPFTNPVFVPDHVCFTAGAEFLFGYGMDRAGRGRGLPDIRIGGKES